MGRRRFFVQEVRGRQAVLRGETADHLRRVLRASVGQRFEISDNRAAWLAEIESFGKQEVRFRTLETLPVVTMPVRLVLLASLFKFDRFEWMLEKATELGVEVIVPVVSERSEKGLEQAAVRRAARWRKILLESSQQARRTVLPVLEDGVPFAEALHRSGRCRLLLDEAPGGTPLLAAVPSAETRSPSDVACLLTGPEGGWTAAERAAAIDAGWAPVSLGPLILRAETATIAALATLGQAWA